MVRQAFISGGVVYHHGLLQPGQPFGNFELIALSDLASTDLNAYDLLVVPRSTDGEVLHARRHQFARFLDQGGVLVTFGEQWANWFPGCHWEEECREDTLEPVLARDHPLLEGYCARDLHWHPATERWCCHGHLVAPQGAEVLVRNARGDAWLYIDRVTTNGVILASTNLDPDTHTYHGHGIAPRFLDRLLQWARAEAAQTRQRRARATRQIAGLYSGVHFQRLFYEDHEFGKQFTVLPVWELGSASLHQYAALWIPRESNQSELVRNRASIERYLAEGGTIVCFEEVNQPWLPVGSWALRPVRLDTVQVMTHPIVAHLTPEQVNWHSHGAYAPYEEAEVLVADGDGAVMLLLDERSFPGRLLAGTMDPDCHVGFGADITRPLLRAILSWVVNPQHTPERELPSLVS